MVERIVNVRLKRELAFLLLFLITGNVLFAQGVSLDNTGGRIYNSGVIRIKAGQVKNLNDTIDGRVEFTAWRPSFTQEIPNIVYNQLVLSGGGLKIVDTVRKVGFFAPPLIARDSLLMIDTARINLLRGDIWALGPIANASSIYGDKEVRLSGSRNQDIWGNGNFPILNLDNPAGASVIKNGGFRVDYKLILSRGELRNSAANNFYLGDSAKIVRYVAGSISEKPNFGKKVDVEYRGDGRITSGPELPDDTATLRNLEVYNSQGLTLTKNVTVSDTLRLSSTIYTEPNDTARFALTLKSLHNPEFVNPNAEIDGSFRRTNLSTFGSPIIFNNRFTYLHFDDIASLNGASEITLRVKPGRFPDLPQGPQKIKRSISLIARNNFGEVVPEIYPRFGYGWRHSTDASINETNNLDVYRVKLQWWNGTDWVDVGEEDIIQFDTTNGWAYNVVRKGSSVRSGDFAFGYSFRYPMAFQARVFLEGAWRNNGMTNDLQVKNLIPQTPPDVFPYNRDPERAKIIVSQIPDSVVDWVVVEFRRTLNDLRPIVYTAFLKTDGRIVGRNGEFPISDANVKFDTGVSSYYVAILHRNHLAIVTEEKIDLIRKPIMAIIDFSKPEIVMGRENALKPLARTREGILFGMLAGEVNGDGLIDNFDQDRIWIERDFEGYILWDVNLDGIVTTRDLNYSINNRGRRSFVP